MISYSQVISIEKQTDRRETGTQADEKNRKYYPFGTRTIMTLLRSKYSLNNFFLKVINHYLHIALPMSNK